jgi:hypothetical protein
VEPPRAGGEHDAAEDQRQPDDQHGQKVGEHDRLEQRRPGENQEGADAADPEDRDKGQPVGEAQAHEPQALGDGADRALPDPAPQGSGRGPEHPFDPVAEGDEADEQQEDFDEAALLHLAEEQRGGSLDLGRQPGRRSGDGAKVHPDRFEPRRELVRSRRRRGRGRSGCRGWSRGIRALPLEPTPHPRIVEQPEEVADGDRRPAGVRLRRRRRGSRRGRGGLRRRRPGEDGENETESQEDGAHGAGSGRSAPHGKQRPS